MEPSAASTPAKTSGRRFPWQSLALEFLSVLLGVLAAFGVTEWRESRSARQRAELALENIAREIAANRDHLQEVHAVNRRLLAEQAGDRDGVQTYALGWGLQSTAWEVARSTGAINSLDYGTVLSLSSLYQFQETYLNLIHGLAQAQMVALLSAQGEDLEQIEAQIDGKSKLYLDLMASNEQHLLSRYEGALEYAGKGRQGPPWPASGGPPGDSARDLAGSSEEPETQ